MDLIIGPGATMKLTPDGAESDGPIGVRDGQMKVGGNFTNTGKVKVFEGGLLDVQRDVINNGDITINDPEKIKDIIIEALKTTNSLASFGSEVLKKLGLYY